MTIRLRFAPSPTGYLHVGGARSALFNYLYAQKLGGKFILRIEDTDTERNKKEFETEILESMTWLGLKWDVGPFYQSQRFDLYRSYVHKLVETGHAYRCYCSSQEIDAMRAKATAEGRKPMYDRRCRDRQTAGEGPSVVRFKTPLTGSVVIDDLIKGRVEYQNEECDDFVILRSNDTPIYNLTVVVDDIDMKISHVIRGEEHLNNTPKQMLIMQALGWQPPKYAHVPLILAPDKTKLSKRHGAVAVTNYREEGYLREALVSYLARLGWSHGDQELFEMSELKQLFDLSGCGASGSVFDRSKLDWVNAQFIKKKSPEEILAEVKQIYKVDLSELLKSDAGRKLYAALCERAVRLSDFVAGARFLNEKVEMDTESVNTVLKTAKADAISTLQTLLAGLSDENWKAEQISPLFKEAAAKIGGKMPDVAKPARVLLTGHAVSPDIGLIVEVLGKKRVMERLAATV